MGLKDIGSALPPGFRFYPSDEELVCHYLYKKIVHHQALNNTLVDIDLHICEPWQLPDVAKLNSDEWYFFSFRGRKYATGFRISRATATGYWKATGKDRTIRHPKTKAVVGMRKTLVFYKSRAPNGIKTSWIMHEFRLENPHLPPKEDWVLCRVFQKSKSKSISGELSPTYAAYDSNIAAVPTSPTLATSPPFDYSLFAGGGYDDHHLSPPLTFPDTPPDQTTSPNNNNSDNIFTTFNNNFPAATNETINDAATNFIFDINYGLSNLRQDNGTVLSELTTMQFDGDNDGGIYDFHING